MGVCLLVCPGARASTSTKKNGKFTSIQKRTRANIPCFRVPHVEIKSNVLHCTNIYYLYTYVFFMYTHDLARRSLSNFDLANLSEDSSNTDVRVV